MTWKQIRVQQDFKNRTAKQKRAPKGVDKTHQKAPRFWLSLAGTPRSCTAKFSLHIQSVGNLQKKKGNFF